MFAYVKTKVQNPALANSRFVFDRIIFLDINFRKLKLTRSSSFLPLPDWITSKKAVINLKNGEGKECFKWAALAALHHENTDSYPERISKLRRFESNYDWRMPVKTHPSHHIRRRKDCFGTRSNYCLLNMVRFPIMRGTRRGGPIQKSNFFLSG